MCKVFPFMGSAGAIASVLVFSLWLIAPAATAPVEQNTQGQNQQRSKPAEGDMREFMGHYFQPTFERLRRSIASQPTSNSEWTNLASNALILAEGGNLLWARSPNEQTDSWRSNATGLRTFGTFVYGAARERDYATAVFNYRHMVEQCNDCHREFAAGEPHLEP